MVYILWFLLHLLIELEMHLSVEKFSLFMYLVVSLSPVHRNIT
jgi:hypothetical protein